VTRPPRRALVVAGAVVLGLLVVGGAGWAWYAHEERQTLRAWAATVSRAETAAGAQATAEQRAVARQAFEAFIQSHPSAPQVSQAAFVLGNLRFAAGEHAQARAAWEIAVARGAAPTLRSLARLSIATAWEAERDFARAAVAYEALLRDLEAGHFLVEETLVSLARVQELSGRKAEAVATYRRVLRDVPTSSRAEQVRSRLASLGAGPSAQ
jgi:TolA-binding protein